MHDPFEPSVGRISFRGRFVPPFWPHWIEHSQEIRTIVVGGQYIPRVKWGRELETDNVASVLDADPDDFEAVCPTCLAAPGEFHVVACPGEECPSCRADLVRCGHGRSESLILRLGLRIVGMFMVLAGVGVLIQPFARDQTETLDILSASILGGALIAFGRRWALPLTPFGALPILCRQVPQRSALCVLGAVLSVILSIYLLVKKEHTDAIPYCLLLAALFIVTAMVLHVLFHRKLGVGFARDESASAVREEEE